MSERRHALTWCTVSVEALRSNAKALKVGLGPGAALGLVVKSEAYGHGLLLTALAVSDLCSTLVVHTVDEGLRLRAALPEHRILVAGPTRPPAFEEAVAAVLELTLSDPALLPELARAAQAVGRPARVHVKVETGTQRQGLDPAEAVDLAARVAGEADLELAALSTHFADIEDTLDHRFAMEQHRRFEEAAAALRDRGVGGFELHCANSAATLLWPGTHHDMVRAGIALYGLWPSRETRLACRLEASRTEPELRPALTWRARITQVRAVPAGSDVGYGRSYRTTAPARIGILGVGYADGYDRGLSNQAWVLASGRRAPIRGRICMNLAMVDLSDIPEAQAGSTVTLLGSEGGETVSAELMAGWASTISYEIPTRIAHDVPRVAVDVPGSVRPCLEAAGIPLEEPKG